MIEFLRQPWPWYVGGVLVGIMVPVLLLLSNKQFGISSSLRHICAACIPLDVAFFKYNWRDHSWNLIFVLGIAIGGFIGSHFLKNPHDIAISEKTKADLTELGITDFSTYVPQQIFNWHSLLTLKGFIMIVVGGFFVGFGTRYASGCTSGHSITGLSLLSTTSLVATIGFFIGGLVMTYLIFPLIFQ